ncbi:MAG: TetR family transcriptional regulator [Polyangiaceae bacterium]
MQYNLRILNRTKSSKVARIAGSLLKIADLERASGVKRSTLHHYLNLGLLPAPERRGPKLHLFGERHLDRLRQIRRLQQRGLALAQIKERLARADAVGASPEAGASPALAAHPHARSERGSRGGTATKSPGHEPRAASPISNHILDVAARLFTEQGYENVHVSDVASAAGVGKATLYQHFKSKSGLFVACIDRLFDVVTAAQSQYIAGEGSSLVTDVERYAAATIASYPSYRMMVSALGAAAFGNDRELAKRARIAFMRLVTMFEPRLKKAMAEGRCREMDSEMLTFMTWGALMAVGARVNHGDRRYTLLEGMRIYVDFMTHGVAPMRGAAR